MQKIDLPITGFTDGADSPVIQHLEISVGERAPETTELFVRGQISALGRLKRWTPFAGTVVLREGRDAVEHDLTLFGPDLGQAFIDALALAVMLALDAHATDLVEAELTRICEQQSTVFLAQTKCMKGPGDDPGWQTYGPFKSRVEGQQKLMELSGPKWAFAGSLLPLKPIEQLLPDLRQNGLIKENA